MTRAIIYCRVSGDDSERDSLNSQADECMAYAKDKGYHVIETLQESARGQSGADMFAPMLQQAITLAEQGKYDALIVRDTTRFTRDRVKGTIVEFSLNQAGVSVEFVWNRFDGEHADILKTLAYWASEQERKAVVKRMREGKERKLAQGSLIPHNKLPLGIGSERVNGIFVPHIIEDEAEIVRVIFRWYVDEKMSARAIAKRLERDKYPTSQGGKWHTMTVTRILSDTTYIGEYHYGKVKIEKTNTFVNGDVVTTRKQTLHDESHHTIISIPPIIDKQTWSLAQKRLEKSRSNNGRKPKYEYLMSRRIRCGNCDSSVHGNAKQKGKYLYYTCEAYRANKPTMADSCIKLLRAGDVDKIVWEWLESLLRDKDLLREKIQTLWQQQQERMEPLKSRLANTEALLEKQKKAYNRLLDIMLQSDDFTLLTDKKKALEDEITGLENEREDVVRNLDEIENEFWLRERYSEPADFDKILFFLGEDYDSDNEPLTFEKKRSYIERYDVQVKITRKNDNFYLKITSDLGNVLREMSHNHRITLQLPQKYIWVISDTLQLAA